MSYVNSVLQPGETVRAVGKLHWIIFGRALLVAVIAFAVLLYADSFNGQTGQFVRLAGWFILAVAGVLFLSASFNRSIIELAVTNHRVIYKRGFLSRHTVEMNMDKVETVDVDQSLLGRMLGFGTIRVRGTGQSIESLRRISHPIQLRNAITAG